MPKSQTSVSFLLLFRGVSRRAKATRDGEAGNLAYSSVPPNKLHLGIARTLDEDGESDLCNVAGTLFYMAPEVGANLLKCCQYDSKVDMWSIGCLLYQCVTGEVRDQTLIAK